MAVFPQVVKLWAAKDFVSFRSLVLVSTRWSFALTSLVGIPLLVATDSILRLWLGMEPPEGAVAFVRCFAVHYLLVHEGNLIESFSVHDTFGFD